MTRERIDNLGAIGLVGESVNSLLPPRAWNTLRNVLTERGALISAPGERRLFNLSIKPTYHTSYVHTNGLVYLIVSDGLRVRAYSVADGSSEDISPNPLVPWLGGFVTFANLNGVLVVNSWSDGLFYLAPPAVPAPFAAPRIGPGGGGGGGAVLGVLTPLPGWDPEWLCREIVAYRYFLVAINMTEGGIKFPHKLRWSNSAAEGELPTEWVAALTNDAGDDLLGETPGVLVGGRVVRDSLFVVKEDAVYALNWTGGEFVMRTDRAHNSVGTRIQKCFASMRGSLAVFTSNDVLEFDGQNSLSLTLGRDSDSIFSTLSDSEWELSEVYVHEPSNTLWLGLASAGYAQLSGALIYNWKENTWGHKHLTFGHGFTSALITLTVDTPTWDELDTTPMVGPGLTWDEQRGGSWNKGLYQPSVQDVILFESNDTNTAWWASVLALNDSNSDGTAKSCQAVRTGISLEGAPGVVMVREIWPEVVGDIPVSISVGGMDALGSTPVWDGPYTFDPLSGVSITPRVTGRYIAIKLDSNAIGSWKFGAMTIDWAPAGER